MNKTVFAGFILLFASAIQAQIPAGSRSPVSPYSPSYNTETIGPRETIQQGVNRIQTFIDGNNTIAPAMLNSFVQKEIAPFFDFEVMTRLILGPLEYQLNTKQRYAAHIMIRNQFLSALTSNLSGYRGGRVDYMNVSGNLGLGRVKVVLRIYQPGQYPMIVELRIARTNKGWKIYDVSANGVSAIAHYRNYIQSIILRSGPEGLTRLH